MNVRKLSLSGLVIAGLLITGNTAQAKVEIKGSWKLGACAGALLALNLYLDSKESVKEPEENYELQDIPKNLFKGNFSEAWGAFDEIIIGQKAKATGIKLVPGEKEVKSTAPTPATGLCGKGHDLLNKVAKTSVDAGKIYGVPLLVLGIITGNFRMKQDEKDGSWSFSYDPVLKHLQAWNLITIKEEKPKVAHSEPSVDIPGTV